MPIQLTEEEMRQALFGSASGAAPEPAQGQRDQEESASLVSHGRHPIRDVECVPRAG